MVNPKIALARLREKAIQEGDGFGYPVSAKEFDEAYEIYEGKAIRDFGDDTEEERILRVVRSVSTYLWREKTLEQALPDLFLEGSSTIEEKTSARITAATSEHLRLAALAREEAEKASIIETIAQRPKATKSTTMIAGMPLNDWLLLKEKDLETRKGKLSGNTTVGHKEQRFKKYRSQKQSSHFRY